MEKGESSMIGRYEHPRIAEIWAPQAVLDRWHRVEVVRVEQIAGADVGEALASVQTPTPAQVAYYERESRHDVMAFLRALDNRLIARLTVVAPEGKEALERARAVLHYGLTSSDVVDTALAMGLQASGPVAVKLSRHLIAGLHRFAASLEPATTVGRTHGQLAAPMPAAHRWDVLGGMVDRGMMRLLAAFNWTDVGKLSGPVGVNISGENAALHKLGLRGAESTQIVPRDRLAHLAHCLAEQATMCEAVATQVWLFAQAGVEEIRLRIGTTSSSAMPHKTNPIAAETIRGLARLARSAAETLQLGVVQWGEHDMAHSSVERVSLVDLLHLTCTALLKTTALVSGLSWEEPRLPEGYVDASERLQELQSAGTPYVEAHAQLTGLYRDGKIVATTGTTEETK
jgi:adenylosuccinate lyase